MGQTSAPFGRHVRGGGGSTGSTMGQTHSAPCHPTTGQPERVFYQRAATPSSHLRGLLLLRCASAELLRVLTDLAALSGTHTDNVRVDGARDAVVRLDVDLLGEGGGKKKNTVSQQTSDRNNTSQART